MNGRIDEKSRALLDIDVRNQTGSRSLPVTCWIDTAFDGDLVFSRALIDELTLSSLGETEAILADGKRINMESFYCFVQWFGQEIPVQVIANEGRLPLLGTGMLKKRVLHIDYHREFLTLE